MGLCAGPRNDGDTTELDYGYHGDMPSLLVAWLLEWILKILEKGSRKGTSKKSFFQKNAFFFEKNLVV